MTDYDDQTATEEYLWRQRAELLTELELRCLGAGLVRRKWSGTGTPEAEAWLREEGALSDPGVNEALKDGLEALDARLRARLVRDHAMEVKRCPDCGRVLATSKAKQCLWCGDDWH